MRTAGTLVETVALGKSYGSRLVLDDVTFSVNAGEVVGLLGPNGAGKTTTLSILATLRAPDRGEVRIAGFDSRVDPGAIRRRLGFVPQSIALYPSLTAFENLELFVRVHGLSAREARDACTKALREIGLADRADEAVSVLSGGMKRRLNLACGMVHRPGVLLLDEPTVGVDPQSREKILQTIRTLAEAGAAAVYSTHYMEEVERLCDRVLLIDQGRLVAEGTVAELIALAGQHHRMEITFQRNPPPDWYAGIAGVTELALETANNTVTLQFASLAQISELLGRARSAGGRVLEFSVHSPNLSDAFMALTGHALRADTAPLLTAS
jgi:linearmycin/streptolysin S transport system ATP-binding protein